MQRTVRLKLVGPTTGLGEPMGRFAEACDHLAKEVSFGRCKPTFHALNAAYYRVLRERFGLMAQVAQTAERHVAGTFRTLRANGHADRTPRFKRPFLKLLAGRGWRVRDGQVVISVPGQRMAFDFQTRALDLQRLQSGKLCGATLVKRGHDYHLNACVELTTPPLHVPVTPIGVDRGIRNLAVARAPGATPLVVRGGRVREQRRRHRRIRQRLQARGTCSAKRVLRNLSGREQRFELDQARVAAKRIIEYAQRFEAPVIVLENLTGIRNRTKAHGHAQRADQHSWAFRLTARCLLDKAEEVGVPTAFVDPAYTSRTCPKCGDARKSNRDNLAYYCGNCGYRNHADVVGATNVSRLWQGGTLALPRGRVNGPNGWRRRGVLHHGYTLTSKPPTEVGGS